MSAPADGGIVVRRCVVRVVRRGGWSWGPDPRGLLQRVLDALPDLLTAEFGEHLEGDGPDLEITEPVRLSVRLSSRGSGGVLTPASLVFESVSGGVSFDSVSVPVPVPMSSSGAADSSTSESSVVRGGVPPTLAELFSELAERHELTALLALLPEETVLSHLSVLLREPGSSVPSGGPIGVLAAELARRLALPEPPATHAGLLELLDSRPAASPAASPAAEVGEDTAPDVARVEAATTPRRVGETRVGSVLPFLLAGPLARTGYLDAIGPALSGVDLLGDAPLFAAALAYKVLGAPKRGWRRTPEDDAAAATFAGCESVPDLTAFARRVRPALPVLDGVLALSLCRGHDADGPLLVTGVDDGLLLVDAHGLFPIAWSATVDGLVPHWAACGRPPVLVRDSPLPPSCLRDLAEAGVRFLTDVRPLRDEPVSRLPSRTPLWTTGGVDPRLAKDFPAEQLAEFVHALFGTHRAVPLAPDHSLEHSVALAASLSLGMIAWQLWRDREPPDPLLALTRFADLEGTVRFTEDAVRVKVPLGRRHTDLWQGGALADVPNVVWLGGRTLTFSGG